MGNICRSPTAQGVFAHLVDEHGLSETIEADSAGTHAYHIGEPPDSRAQQSALQRGIDLSAQRARKVSRSDFDVFDYVLAMDAYNFELLEQICPAKNHHRLSLFFEFAPDAGIADVPDPYYGGPRGFDQVLDLVEEGARGLLEHIKQAHGL